MRVSIRFTTLCTGARIVNILPSTVSLAESCSSCSSVFHEQQLTCRAFTGKDCAAVIGAICSSCSITDQSPHSISPSSFSESRSKTRIVAEGSISVRWNSCIPVRSASVSYSRLSFSVNNSLITLSRSTHLLIFSFYFDIALFGVTISLMSLSERY